MSLSTFHFEDDFSGAGHAALPLAGSPGAGYAWVKKIVGAAPPPVAILPRKSGGVFQLALAAGGSGEKENAVLYWNDACVLDATKGLVFECRAALLIPPNATGVQAVFGVADVWADGPDNNAHYLEFGCSGNANLLCRWQDGLTQNALPAVEQVTGRAGPLWSPSTLPPIAIDASFHTFRIEIPDPGDVGFFFDGARVNSSGSIRFEATGDSAILQPYFAVYKPSGNGLATLQVDAVRAWQSL